MTLPHDPLGLAALACAAAAVPFLLYYLIRRPPLTRTTKVVLLLGVGVFPILSAGTGNVAGFEATKARTFCGACHVMTPYAKDSEDPRSTTLAARHARNDAFGHENCYACHADYGMFGTIVTKAGGMRHVYEYLTHFHKLSFEDAEPKIHLRKPFNNGACTRCHSTENPHWNEIGDHAGLVEPLRQNKVSCVGGCHGPAHPFKPPTPAWPGQVAP